MQKESHSALEDYWQRYLKSNPKETATGYVHFYFCDNEEDARELAELVVAGKKRATTSSLTALENDGQHLPKRGDCSIITDYHGKPLCIVKTVKVKVVPFKEVTREYAAIEGEGDGSLEYWRSGHIRFFTRECESLGMQFSEEMNVVCEQFEVVFI